MKKMLWNWDMFVNDRVIETSNDDRTYLYILYMNGYKPKTCSKYNIRSIVNDMSNKSEVNKLVSNSNFKHGEEYDDWVRETVMNITQKPIQKSFGFFNGNKEQTIPVKPFISYESTKTPTSRGLMKLFTNQNIEIKEKSSRISKLREDIAEGRVVRTQIGNTFVWKRIK